MGLREKDIGDFSSPLGIGHRTSNEVSKGVRATPHIKVIASTRASALSRGRRMIEGIEHGHTVDETSTPRGAHLIQSTKCWFRSALDGNERTGILRGVQ